MTTENKRTLTHVVVFSVIIFLALFIGYFIAGVQKARGSIFGQQFLETDLEGTTGIVKQVVVACDQTDLVVPDLISDNFVPWNITEFNDVSGDQFRVTFWARSSDTGDIHIITQSHVRNGVTCILSVSKDINNSTDSKTEPENDRKPAVLNSEEQVA